MATPKHVGRFLAAPAVLTLPNDTTEKGPTKQTAAAASSATTASRSSSCSLPLRTLPTRRLRGRIRKDVHQAHVLALGMRPSKEQRSCVARGRHDPGATSFLDRPLSETPCMGFIQQEVC